MFTYIGLIETEHCLRAKFKKDVEVNAALHQELMEVEV